MGHLTSVIVILVHKIKGTQNRSPLKQGKPVLFIVIISVI